MAAREFARAFSLRAIARVWRRVRWTTPPTNVRGDKATPAPATAPTPVLALATTAAVVDVIVAADVADVTVCGFSSGLRCTDGKTIISGLVVAAAETRGNPAAVAAAVAAVVAAAATAADGDDKTGIAADTGTLAVVSSSGTLAVEVVVVAVGVVAVGVVPTVSVAVSVPDASPAPAAPETTPAVARELAAEVTTADVERV